jgi:hypothetical protein
LLDKKSFFNPHSLAYIAVQSYRMIFKKILLPLIFATFLMPSCQAPKDLVFREVQNVSFQKIGFAGTILKVDMVYYNPNNFGLQLSRTDLDLFIDSTFLGHSLQDIQVAIPKRDIFVLPLSINLDMKNLLKNGIISMFNKEIKLRLLGSVKVGKAGVYKTFKVDYTTIQNFSFYK